MAKQYPKRSMNYKARGKRTGSFLSVFLAFFCGYLLASVLDLKALIAWFNSQLGAKKTEQQAIRPTIKPKFEFYTLLANDNRTQALSPKPKVKEVLAPPKKIPPAPVSIELKLNNNHNNEVYLLQVASFNLLKEAERLKASLVLNGYEVSVNKAMQGTTLWYKVSAGPFRSKTEAEKAQIAIAKMEHMTGVIRKISG